MYDYLIKEILKRKSRVVSICGPADVGKSYIARKLVSELKQMSGDAILFGLDSYLLSRQERNARGLSGYNPESHDLTKARADLEKLIAGETIRYHEYKHETGITDEAGTPLKGTKFIIVEGLHAQHSLLIPLVDFSIYVFTLDENLVEIRKKADLVKRKLTEAQAIWHSGTELEQYHKHVHPYIHSSDICLQLETKWQYRIERKTRTFAASITAPKEMS